MTLVHLWTNVHPVVNSQVNYAAHPHEGGMADMMGPPPGDMAGPPPGEGASITTQWTEGDMGPPPGELDLLQENGSSTRINQKWTSWWTSTRR